MTGIRSRHSRRCASREGGRCSCTPSYEAWVYSKRDGRKIRRTFTGKGALAAAKGWRIDAAKQVKDRVLRAPVQTTLRQEVEEWLAGARSGAILSKHGKPYKPGTVRNYELALRLRALDSLGDRKIADIDLADLIDLKEQLHGEGCGASVIRNTFVPMQAIYRRARLTGRVPVDPTVDLPLPAAGQRDRAATPAQAAALLAPLDDLEAAIWATAFYAGLRRGELRGLRVRDVDLELGVISIERGWDDKEGPIDPKTIAGRRKVFVLDILRPYVHDLVDRRGPDELLFGEGESLTFDSRNVARKAGRDWDAADKARTEGVTPLERFTLHECRHSFSTWMDHAGVSPDRADRYMGHSSGSVARRYRHLLPDQIAEDRKLVDAYLEGTSAGKVIALSAVTR